MRSKEREQGAEQFYGDMTQEEAWDWLTQNLRTTVAHELDQLRTQGGLSQSALAERIQATQPMLSRFFKGLDERSPTLDTLVKLAWGLNRYVEINFVSDVPSRDTLYPVEAPAGRWPTPLPADATGNDFIKLAGTPLMKSHDVKLEAPAEQAYQPIIDTSFSTEFLPLTPVDPRQQNSPLLLRVESRLVTDIKDGANAGKRLMRIRTSLEVSYHVDPKAPQKERDGLAEFAKKQTIRHVWPFYGDILKTAAVRAGMPVNVIRLVQKHLAEYVQNP